jgi:hypothetical protein
MDVSTLRSDDGQSSCSFRITRQVVKDTKDTTKADMARRVNLVKANLNWKRRLHGRKRRAT